MHLAVRRAARVPLAVPARHLARRSAVRSRISAAKPLSSAYATCAASDDEVIADEVDLLIVGAGPAGLSAAIRAKQLNENLRVCVIEKGSEVGAHTLSGAVIEPRAMDELLPEWRSMGAEESFPRTPVTVDRFKFLTETHSFSMPVVPTMHNTRNFIVSLGQVVRFLGKQAEEMGVEIYSGISGSDVVYHEDGKSVKGVKTADVGILKDGTKGPNYERGMELYAKATLFGEGCRGSLTKTLFSKFPHLRADCQPQTYGIGLKELWEVPKEQHELGLVEHTVGWPMDNATYGGSFMYHLHDNKVALGFVIGLDYTNSYLNPYKEFQRFKQHPEIARVLTGGTVLSYGARAINEGGLQSLPHLALPGAALLGCAAGTLNVPKIKGTHLAMKTGIIAAETAVEELKQKESAGEDVESVQPLTMSRYEKAVHDSWVVDELREVRNIRPAFQNGFVTGALWSGIDLFLLKGRVPFTFKHKHADHETLELASKSTKIEYPKPDGKLSFDLLDSVSRTGTYHNEDQPPHLKLSNDDAININLPLYDNPETRYCPAGVYEIVEDEAAPSGKKLQINAQNCIHCKTCDIKDEKVTWTVPEGGGGPAYAMM